MSTAERSLLLIGEDEPGCQSMARSLRLLCPVETRALCASPSLPRLVPTAVVISGISLRGVQKIAQIRQALRPFLERRVPVLCILDEPSDRDNMQARAVGASAVLPSSAPMRTVADVLHSLTSCAPKLAGELGVAVQDVGFVIANLMNAAAIGESISATVTAEASRLLLETVRSVDIERWMTMVSTVHDQTYRHCILMAGVTAAFTVSLNFNANDCDLMTHAAMLHDVGKALVPLEVLNKPDVLTPAEMAIMRQHAEWGYQLLKKQGDHHPMTLRIARHHHEYLDGSGYPLGLMGDAIPDEVRIATLCDVFVALIEQRPYRPPLTSLQALDIMLGMQGQLDVDLLRLFRSLFVSVEARKPGPAAA